MPNHNATLGKSTEMFWNLEKLERALWRMKPGQRKKLQHSINHLPMETIGLPTGVCWWLFLIYEAPDDVSFEKRRQLFKNQFCRSGAFDDCLNQITEARGLSEGEGGSNP